MGLSIHYQALPEQSTLFKRLQTEKAFNTLFYHLFKGGNGILDMFDLDKEEREEILEWMVEDEEVFSSEVEVERYLNELCLELKCAEAVHPGLVNRHAYLEKDHQYIEELLSQELKRKELNNYIDYLEKLLYSNQKLAPKLHEQYEDQLLLVPSSVIQDSSLMLHEVEKAWFEITGGIFEDRWGRIQRWIKFYIESADKGEAVVIRFS